jgi:tRNA (guanine-N7-)-methyltransferase
MGIQNRDALARMWGRFGHTVGEPLALVRPLVVEIGFGMGDATATMAAADPDRDYLGVEIHTPGVARLLGLIEERGLTNVRVARGDALELLRGLDTQVDAIHAFFPDPWPKARHHKRRLIQPAHVALFTEKLAQNGKIRTATDDAGYAEAMRDTLTAEPRLAESESPGRPVTKFEQRALDAGRTVTDLTFVKR